MRLIFLKFTWGAVIFCLKHRCKIIWIGKTDHIGNFGNGIVFIDEQVFDFFKRRFKI